MLRLFRVGFGVIGFVSRRHAEIRRGPGRPGGSAAKDLCTRRPARLVSASDSVLYRTSRQGSRTVPYRLAEFGGAFGSRR